MQSSVFKKEFIFTNIDCKNKQEALKFISEKAKLLNISSDASKTYEGLVEREKEFTTNLGEFIAIPHTKNQSILSPSVLFIKFKEPIVWGEKEEKVKVCISLLMTVENSNKHLKLLSNISRKLINDEFKASLLANNDDDKIFEIINNVLNI